MLKFTKLARKVNFFITLAFKQNLARISCRFYAAKVRSSFLTFVINFALVSDFAKQNALFCKDKMRGY